MAASRSSSIVPFVLVGLVIALVIGVVFSNFAAETPDALQRAVINSACQDAASEEEIEDCVTEQEGEPVLAIQPEALAGYEVTWLSGLVGVLACFVIGAGIVFLLRRTGSSTDTSARVR